MGFLSKEIGKNQGKDLQGTAVNNKKDEQKKIQWLIEHQALIEHLSLRDTLINSKLKDIATQMQNDGLYSQNTGLEMIVARLTKLIEKANRK
jgi:hypothetical protein